MLRAGGGGTRGGSEIADDSSFKGDRRPPAGRPDHANPWVTAQKILTQELRTGCADRTVFGGLERFLSKWSSSLAPVEGQSSMPHEARGLVSLLKDYGGRSAEERAAALRAALALVGEVLSEAHGEMGRRGDDGPSPPPRTTSQEQKGKPSLPLGEGRGEGRTHSSQRPATSPGNPELRTQNPEPTRRPAAGSLSVRRSQPTSLSLDEPIVALRGVGKLRASKLAKLGIEKLRDLLLHFPRDYRDFRAVKRVVDLMYGETASVVGIVEDIQVMPGPNQRFRTTVKVRDESGRVSATWFRYGYAGSRIAPHSRIALAGTVAGHGGQISFDNPDWEDAAQKPLHTRRLVPVYPLTEGVSDYWLRELMAELVPVYAPRVEEHLPSWLVQQYDLMAEAEAVATVHLPRSLEETERARRRLAFDELFLIQLSALKTRAEWRAGSTAPRLRISERTVESFLAHQPFSLTGAQRRVAAEILADMESAQPMTRLLQGEVGSGKTIVAAVALLAAVAGGCQGAIMVPTEILAEQHARTLRAAFERAEAFLTDLLGRPLRLELLTGAARRSERDMIYRGTAGGEVDILVGTQALVQEGLGFQRLGMAVIDEQHRFGVVQRATLREKGGSPHLLVMTATPIPRTMALTLYGDLDLSVIDELPPGRQQVKTVMLGPLERGHAYERIRREVASGRQAFIICPLVEDSPHLEVRAATAEYERLRQGELAGLRLALLHGRMRPAEKDRIMLDFRQGEYDVLVSTSVVEVGIDVPNASVVLIEGAERFGLAQLHQFRGRVGRGAHASVCILLSDSQEDGALERLRTVAAVSDGFRLAEEDLKLRGPGDYVGVRQSGIADLRVADLRDLKMIETARAAAMQVLAQDPELALPAHAALLKRVEDIRRGGNA